MLTYVFVNTKYNHSLLDILTWYCSHSRFRDNQIT